MTATERPTMQTDRETTEAERIELPEPIKVALKALQKAAFRHGWVRSGDGDAPDSAAEFRHAVQVIAAALTPAPPEPPAGMAEVERPDVAEMMWAVEDAFDAFVDDIGTRDQLFDKICAVAEALRAAYRRNDALRAALASLRAERAVPEEWQPIETAPKDGTSVLVFGTMRPFLPDRVFVARWREDVAGGAWVGPQWRCIPLCWRPLPEPPRTLIQEPRNG